MQNLFLVGVGNVFAYKNGQLVLTSKTELNTGIEVGTGNTEIRGGEGNQLLYIYYHTGTFAVTLEDTQWMLDYLAYNTGADIAVGGDFIMEETLVVTSGNTVTASETPLEVDGSTAYARVELNGTVTHCVCTGKSIDVSAVPGVATDDEVCVTYLYHDGDGKHIEIPANIVPDQLHFFIKANLATNKEGSGVIGQAIIEVPVGQLSGAQTISMTADGYSTTPLTVNALAYRDTTAGCAGGAYYAKISQLISGEHWYDGVSQLAIEGGDFTLANGKSKKLRVWAIANGKSFLCDNSQLTFTSGTAGVATADATGTITAKAASGTSVVTVKVTDKAALAVTCTVTASAS